MLHITYTQFLCAGNEDKEPLLIKEEQMKGSEQGVNADAGN